MEHHIGKGTLPEELAHNLSDPCDKLCLERTKSNTVGNPNQRSSDEDILFSQLFSAVPSSFSCHKPGAVFDDETWHPLSQVMKLGQHPPSQITPGEQLRMMGGKEQIKK